MPAATAQEPRARAGAMVFILITVVLDNLALGLIVPVLPKLIGSLGAGGAGRTALLFGAFAAVFAVMQFLAAPVQGALSDRFGRRPVILASNAGLGLDYLIMAIAPNVSWLFVGRLISGVAAGSGPAAYAYLADVTPADRRAANFGLVMAAQAIGAALGPAVGGALSVIDLRAPFWAAAALSLANFAYGLFVLPESLAKERRSRLRFGHLNPFGALVGIIRAHPELALMVVTAFLLSLGSQGANNVVVLYAGYRYRWGPAEIGVLLTVFAVLSLAVQGGAVSFAAKRFGERGSMIGGLALNVIGLAVFGLAPSGLVFAAGVPLMALGSIAAPMMGAIFSNAVGDDEQGRLQGAWTSVNAIMGMLAPVLFSSLIFARSVAVGPAWSGAAFFVAAAMIAVGLALAVRGSAKLARGGA